MKHHPLMKLKNTIRQIKMQFKLRSKIFLRIYYDLWLIDSSLICICAWKILFDIFHHLFLLRDAISFATSFRPVQTAFYESHQTNDNDHRYYRPNETCFEIKFIAEQFAEWLWTAIFPMWFLEQSNEWGTYTRINHIPKSIHTLPSVRPHSPFG